MARLPDWPERLAALIVERRRAAFAWGTNDCGMWAADAVLATTGADPAAPYRGRYADARQAARIARGTRGLEHLARKALGEPIAPLMAAIGDVGLVVTGDVRVLGVCNGGVWLVVAADGLAAVPLEAAVAAWRT